MTKQTSPTEEWVTAPHVRCTFWRSSGITTGRQCGKTASEVGKRYDGTYEPRCGQHAGVERRKKYGNLTMEPLTVEIATAIRAEQDEADERERVRRDEKNAEREPLTEQRRQREWDESLIVPGVTRNDKQDLIWESVREDAPRYNLIPRWQSDAPHGGWGPNEVTVENLPAVSREDGGWPVVLATRISSNMTVNEAEAVIAMLGEAVKVAKGAAE